MIPADRKLMQVDLLTSAIVARRKQIPKERALLVGISGIDASGKGFVTRRVADSLAARTAVISDSRDNLAVIGADGWLNLPPARFNQENPGEHFYEHAFRFDEMFETLIFPLRQNREIDLCMDYTEEIANDYRPHRYQFREIDIILVEGIFLLKRALRHHFDLTCWVACSFETALARAVRRCQEGLPPLETIRAFTTIYFPAQQIHFERDAPQVNVDFILPNEEDPIEALPTASRSLIFASQVGGTRSK